MKGRRAAWPAALLLVVSCGTGWDGHDVRDSRRPEIRLRLRHVDGDGRPVEPELVMVSLFRMYGRRPSHMWGGYVPFDCLSATIAERGEARLANYEPAPGQDKSLFEYDVVVTLFTAESIESLMYRVEGDTLTADQTEFPTAPDGTVAIAAPYRVTRGEIPALSGDGHLLRRIDGFTTKNAEEMLARMTAPDQSRLAGWMTSTLDRLEKAMPADQGERIRALKRRWASRCAPLETRRSNP